MCIYRCEPLQHRWKYHWKISVLHRTGRSFFIHADKTTEIDNRYRVHEHGSKFHIIKHGENNIQGTVMAAVEGCQCVDKLYVCASMSGYVRVC